jgi:formylglycine-generating enzyme required for sulfatase activity
MVDRKLLVFLCYSSEDKFDVREFYNQLSAEDWIYPWLDEEEVLPGMNWEVEIEKAVETADAVIVFLSRNSVNQDGYIHHELKLVLNAAEKKPEGSIFVIPLKLNECEVPTSIRSRQYIDYSLPETRKLAYRRLLKSLMIKNDLVNRRTGKTESAHILSAPSSQLPALEAQDFQKSDIQPKIQTQNSEMQNIQTASGFKPWTFGGFNFLGIPKGKFIIGSKASNTSGRENEIPQCPCTIPYSYWISRFPISNEQFSEFAFSTKFLTVLPKNWLEKLKHPIVGVSWHDAVSYTHWLNEVFSSEIPSDMVFRLPTEAEWERASRGDFASEWPWGNESLDELLEKKISSSVGDTQRNYQKVKNKIEALRCSLSIIEVGSFSPLMDSPFGITDMMGSIGEWTQSLYAPYPYDAHDGRENLEIEGKRVIRGYFKFPKERFSVRSARRAWALPERKAPVLGFRIVIAPPIL